jgi:predicted O-methyltransferase YrrM
MGQVKAFIKRIAPRILIHRKRLIDEQRKLRQIAPICANASRLMRATDIPLQQLFLNAEYDRRWRQVEDTLTQFFYGTTSRSVNAGDLRAIFYLTSYCKPDRVLEIGTHVGASAASIALALRQLSRSDPQFQPHLTTVDIVDVNDTTVRVWDRFGVPLSPKAIVGLIGCAELVSFVTSPSEKFLTNTTSKFDFIFLDSSHAASTSYAELARSLAVLTAGGCILIHDYFPGSRPLWRVGNVLPGPYLAVQRLIRECPELTIMPLGTLPWSTKTGSHTTSLALLSRT